MPVHKVSAVTKLLLEFDEKLLNKTPDLNIYAI